MATIPRFLTGQLWALNEGKETKKPIIEHQDRCCFCNREYTPTPLEKGEDGKTYLTVTAIGSLCPACQEAHVKVFYPDRNIRNITPQPDGSISFQVLIDSTWEEAKHLGKPDSRFAETVKPLYVTYIADKPIRPAPIVPAVIAITHARLMRLAQQSGA